MNRIMELDPAQATGKTKYIFDGVQSKLGVVPDLVRVLGNAPAALEGYLNFSRALSGGIFNSKVREQIALAVAESTLCDYCLSAHTLSGRKAGLTEKDIADARHASAAHDKTDAILKLVRNIVVQRGGLRDADLKRARASALTDAEIVETIANVSLNIFAIYVNHLNHVAN